MVARNLHNFTKFLVKQRNRMSGTEKAVFGVLVASTGLGLYQLFTIPMTEGGNQRHRGSSSREKVTSSNDGDTDVNVQPDSHWK